MYGRQSISFSINKNTYYEREEKNIIKDAALFKKKNIENRNGLLISKLENFFARKLCNNTKNKTYKKQE